MSEFVVVVFRLSFLLLLWLFVLFAVFSIRSDMFGLKSNFSLSGAGKKIDKKEQTDYKVGKNEPTNLFVSTGELKGTNIPLVRQQVLKVGRDPKANIVIDDQYTSNDHAEIFDENGNWYLQDIGSTNGTYLNGKKIDTENIIKGDVITIGQTDFEVG